MSNDSLSSETPVSKEKNEQAKPVSLIYVGPSLGGGKLTRFTVYQGGKPNHTDQLFTDCPEIERLFVPVDKLADTLTAIEITGTPYNTWYNRAVEYQQKGAKS